MGINFDEIWQKYPKASSFLHVSVFMYRFASLSTSSFKPDTEKLKMTPISKLINDHQIN